MRSLILLFLGVPIPIKAAPNWQPGSGWVSQGELGRRMRPVLASRWALDHLNSRFDTSA